MACKKKTKSKKGGKKKCITLMCLGLLLSSGALLASCSNSSAMVVKADDGTSSGEVIEDTSTTTSEEEEFIQKLKNAWDTYLVPILGSVSIASVLSAAISIALAIFNRKTNIKNRKEIIETTTLSATVITTATALMNEIRAGNVVMEETKIAFAKASEELLKKVAELTGKTEDLQKLKPVLAALASIQVKVAQGSKELIRNGVSEDINNLLDQIKNW